MKDIKEHTNEELIEIVKECLDPDCYMGIDVLKDITINEDKTVSITLELVQVKEDNYIGFNGY